MLKKKDIEMIDLSKLVKMSNTYGANPDYVLAGGGNTSVKDENTLYVKCSGTQLKTITEDGFVAMDRRKLDVILKKDYPKGDKEREAAYLADVMQAICDSDASKRPSVEALLHNLFSFTYVLHVHPALINGLTCSKGAKELCIEILGEDVLWIDAVRPGYTLARVCADQMAAHEKATGRKIQVIMLQNHGIFVGADTTLEIDNLFNGIIEKLKAHVGQIPDMSKADAESEKAADASAKALEELSGKTVKPVDVKAGIGFSKDKESAAPLMRPFTPDHIVYCGPYPLFLESEDDYKAALEARLKETGIMPKVLIVKGKGVFVMADSEAACEKPAMLIKDAMKIAVYAEGFGGALPLSEDLVQFILGWEAESYRSSK